MTETVEEKYHVGAPLGILCNPRGGRARGDIDVIRQLAGEIPGSVYREASSPEAIHRALSELLDPLPGALCFIGGDGTIQAALTSLRHLCPPERWPVLAALPGGTTNMTAKDLGSWPTVIAGLKALAHGGRGSSGPPWTLRRRPVLEMNGGGIEGLCGMFLGLGGVAAGIRAWNEDFQREDLPGDGAIRLTILRLLLKLAFRRSARAEMIQPLTFSLDGGAETRHRGILVLVTSLHRLILGARPYWGPEPHPLHVTLVEEGARGFWWRIPRLIRGRPGGGMTPRTGYLSRNAERVELTLDGPFVVDGELFEARAAAGPLTITPIPGVDWLVPS